MGEWVSIRSSPSGVKRKGGSQDLEAPQYHCLPIGISLIRGSSTVPLLTNRDISLIRRVRLYSSCVRSSMLHRSEAWSVRKENELALQRAEMRMVR